MTNSVNAFELMVESVRDNHVAKTSVFAHSTIVISSFRNLGWRLKLRWGEWMSPDRQVSEPEILSSEETTYPTSAM